MSTQLSIPPTIDKAMRSLADPKVAIEDKAAIWAVLYRIQDRMRKSMGLGSRGNSVKDELIYHMEQEGPLGPLSVKATAAEVQYPINDEGNWSDETTQSFLRDVVLPVTPEYVRVVPEHLEIDVKALGEAVHLGDPAARQLWTELNRRRWRTEGYKRLSIAVQEVKEKGRAAA